MAEQLESLLARIQKEGVDKAQSESERILSDARRQAERLLHEAQAKADALLRQAETDRAAAVERGTVALKQAARDVMLSLAESVNRSLRALLQADVKAALDPQTLGRLIEVVVAAYVKAPAGQQRLEVLLPPAQQQALVEFAKARLSGAMREGLTFAGDGRVLAGFRVAVKADSVEHDFTDAALTNALCDLLRPHLAKIVREAAPSA